MSFLILVIEYVPYSEYVEEARMPVLTLSALYFVLFAVGLRNNIL